MPEAEDYTIGWVCALSKELIAAKAFLDVLHDPVDNAAINDDNSYTLGSIGKHNVVIAVLPYGQYGLVNAAAALKDMTRTFSNLRAVLMVGIGGGVPCKKDIRLGDIVVGSVGRNSSGVIQYDYGRAIQGEEFAVTGHLNQSPMAFLTAMSALHASYEMEGHSIDSNIDKALQKYKRLGKKYKRPEASTDRLYKADFVHEGGESVVCSKSCGDDKLVHRDERGEDENSPTIHCGLIASGNQLMKDASLRDKLAAKHDILCFEMEAAGLMNHFPCVIIRGICDYSDSHKNDEWQGYAAMAAAAYTKDLLLQVAPSSVQKEERIETLLGQLNDKVANIHQIATDSNRDIKSLSSSVRDDAISRWLNPADPSVDHNKAREACHSGTGRWLLNYPTYLAWKSQVNSFLWLNGNSGRGKTILSSIVIEDIRNSSLPQLRNSALLYFYITFTDHKKQSLDAILRSLINQLYRSWAETRRPITSLHSKCGGGSSQATIEQLKSTFRDMLSDGGEVFIVIDALDEYQNRSTQRDELLNWIQSFCNDPVNTHLLVTSRPEHDIKTSIETWADSDSIISLRTDNVGRDISDYVRDVVTKSTSFRRWHGHTSTQDDIVNTLTEKADGVFRWVALQLERLKDCINKEEVKTTLDTLPTTLQETYYRVINELTSTRRKYVIRILQFLAYSNLPMELEAAVDALAIDLTAPPGSRFIMKERMPLPAEIASLCSTLFVAVSRTSGPMLGRWYDATLVLQLAHSSVKEFILSCPRTELDGLLTKSTARLTITEICLVYFLEINCSLSYEELMRTHHLLPFAVERWIRDASYHRSRLRNFTHLSMELFSNHLLFKRWSYFIEDRFHEKRPWHSGYSLESDEVLFASWSEDQNCVKTLLEARATGDTTAWNLDPALHLASEFGHLETVALLVREGADVNAKGAKHNVLCTAIKAGHKDIISLLIKEGADVNAQQGPYSNALEVASGFGHLNIVELLIKEGADVNAQSEMGTALEAASESGHLNVVMHLVEKGAHVNAQAPNGTALQAASTSGYLDIVIFLLEKGADINARRGRNYSALQCASQFGHLDIAKYLLNNGADVNAQGGVYGTALCVASRSGYLNIVKYLVEKGADVNAQGGVYGTALCAASHSGYLNIVKYLVEKGADENAPAGRFENAFDAAITLQQDTVVKFIHNYKTDLS
ncbi:hypothetical protein FOPG_11125 [Fusarium oxysporum f. sp. conglutinans race 2 54008]|uniref:NACHT domain-containing protein n=1 Tax=Fusarium oxysporum f. sp. conglutinans race 2 54008 TaxID=1089457 RepID=X0HC50_FUSOX|nr:hypothetical protein FOPG_11125 [Fusarium oxysporum f. sp. conglutinans race 2 54008]KAI8407868.1 hypothetical protein FOFC_10796 [Fusarium oxysporum]